MCDVDVPFDKQKDIRGIKLGPDNYKQRSRDPFRSPMIWSDENSVDGGFSLLSKVEPWLPMPENYTDFAVSRQKSDSKSHLNFFRRLLNLRTSRSLLNRYGRNIIFPHFDTLDDRLKNDILIFVRNSSQNFSESNLLIVLYLDNSNDAVDNASKVYLDLSNLTQIFEVDLTAKVLLTTPNVTDLRCDKIIDLRSFRINVQHLLAMEWWKTGPIYEVYIRSFKDSNNDGIGDIKGAVINYVVINFLGIVEKIPYLNYLGVKGIWVTPFFQSGEVDNGYDIIDHCQIDRKFGNIDDFKELLDKAHQCGIHVIIDVIANHTSDQCTWFQKSIQRIDPYTDFYIWRDGKIDLETGDKLPPTNWASRFGGSAWTFDKTRKQYYMHTFHPQQPNLNCRNRSVMEEILKILKFWIDLGVDGFRLDAVKHMVCDAQFRDNATEELYFSFKGRMHIKANQRFDYDQPEIFSLLRTITDYVKKRSRIENRSILIMTEAYTSSENIGKYFTEAGADMPLNFCLTQWNWETSNAVDLEQMINQSLTIGKENNFWLNWVVGNHDRSRIGSRLKADSNGGIIDQVNMLMFLLPGTPIFYYGEELGMLDSDISFADCVDEVGKKLGPEEYKKRTRDPCRAPFPWTDEIPNAGFTSPVAKSWLPLPKNCKGVLGGLGILTQNVFQGFLGVLGGLAFYKKVFSAFWVS
uniref:Alpha-amylase n=1 Tax=Romanomermis culicivorax TaxID=13658 RepID=A0A915KE70_ROMCU